MVSSLVTFFGGLFILLPCHVLYYRLYADQARKNALHRRFPVFRQARAGAQRLLSGNGPLSKLVVRTPV